ncbi:hypothetical protein GCM10010182_71180 [Actinomadura cremea]|nr:hypothetical protein GCM10010182_71180 [Actinomadura cremea]
MIGPALFAAASTVAARARGVTGFAVRQRRVRTPLVDFILYRDRRFAGASLAAALPTLGTGSTLFVLTRHLQLVLGFSAPETGAALGPLAAGVAAGGARGPRRIGARWSIVAGFLGVLCGFLVLAGLDERSGYLPVAIGLAVLGARRGAGATPRESCWSPPGRRTRWCERGVVLDPRLGSAARSRPEVSVTNRPEDREARLEPATRGVATAPVQHGSLRPSGNRAGAEPKPWRAT